MKENSYIYEDDSQKMNWFKRNWKKILIVGTGIAAVVGGIVIYKNWDDITEWFERKSLDNIDVDKVEDVFFKNENEIMDDVNSVVNEAYNCVSAVSEEKVVLVCEHVRTLPPEQHASARKLQEALERNIVLNPRQTLVNSYERMNRRSA